MSINDLTTSNEDDIEEDSHQPHSDDPMVTIVVENEKRVDIN